MNLSLIFLTFGLIFSEAMNNDPGVKGRLTLKGLQYGWQVGLEEMQKTLATVKIPDVSGSVSVDVLGRIYYYVTELQIKNLDVSNSNVLFSPGTGVTVSVTHGEISITGHIGIKTVLFSAGTWLELRVQELSLAGVLGITCDDYGHGAVWNAGCSSSAGHVDLWFHGGSGWLFNMFKNAIMGPIHDALDKMICPQFGKAVTQMEQTLNSLPVSWTVDSVSSLEFPLTGPPPITDMTLDLLVKGQFIGRPQHWELPYSPEKLALPNIASHMLLLAVSQFSANSAGYVHYKAGFLRRNVTDDMIPKQSPLRLNTRSLGVFVPELPSRFPDSPPLLLQVSARSAPTVNCQLDSLTVQVSSDVEVFAMYPGRPLVPLFQIQADTLTEVDIVLAEETLGATLSVKNFSLSLVHSDVGEVKVNSLQKTLSFGIKIALPLVNDRLKKMFPLPTNMLRLQDPVVRVLEGYVVIMTDLQVYAPSPAFDDWNPAL